MVGKVADWSLYRTLLAVTRAGTLAGAAEILGTSISTVHRHLGELEAALGTRLFERRGRGRALTEAGETLAQQATRIEDEVLAIERRVGGADETPRGRVVLTTTDTLAHGLLARYLPELRERYPEIHLDVSVDNRHFRLGRGEADVALRPGGQSTEPDVVARHLADVAFSYYASRGYIAKYGRPKRRGDLAQHAAIVVDDSLAHIVYGRVAEERTDPALRVFRTPSLLLQARAVESGIGIAALPCFLMDGRPDVVRLFRPEPETTLHLLFHADQRRIARVRVVIDWLTEAVTADHPLLSGAG